MDLSINIVNWNGKHLLKKCLPSIIKAADYTNKKYEIRVVDNGSVDGSIGFLRLKFPNVKITALEKNMGFSVAQNVGAKQAKGNILIFLANDIMLKKDSIKHMIKYLKDPKVFGVSPKILTWDRKTLEAEFLGCSIILGTVVQTQPGLHEIDKNKFKDPRLTFYAYGGASAIDRKKFLKLGGFDEIYSPFYWEEVDLSYRAYKRGWVVIYEPKAVVYHKHRATVGKKFSKEHLHIQELKTRFIFTWSNFYDPVILLKHFAFLPLVFLRSAFISSYRSKRFLDVKAFFQALKYKKRIIRKRLKEMKYIKHSDREVLDLINTNEANLIAPVHFGKFFGKK